MAPARWLEEYPAVRRWLELEQTVNDHAIDTRHFAPIDESTNGVRPEYRAASQASWELDVCWVPRASARVLGPLDMAGIGVRPHRGRVPLFVHPQGRGIHRRAVERWGVEPSRLRVTPTSSERSLLTAGDRPPCIVKVSLGVAVGGRLRAVRERDIARALVVSRVLETVPEAYREALGLEVFPDLAGVVVADEKQEASRGHAFGWMLRALPPSLLAGRDLLPLFSLTSRREGVPPLLVEMIERAGSEALEFVEAQVLRPYVQALAYLILDQGLVVEPHAQNVALGLGADGTLDGRVVLRDFSDASVNVALRLAKQRDVPATRPGTFDATTPFSVYDEAVRPLAHLLVRQRHRAELAVVRYGMQGVVWGLQRALAPRLGAAATKRIGRTYLELWQRAVAHYTGVVPSIRGGRGLAIDDAILELFRRTDWRALGAGRSRAWPRGARPLRWAPLRRASRVAYREIDLAWGTLGLFEDGTPVYFVPADG